MAEREGDPTQGRDGQVSIHDRGDEGDPGREVSVGELAVWRIAARQVPNAERPPDNEQDGHGDVRTAGRVDVSLYVHIMKCAVGRSGEGSDFWQALCLSCTLGFNKAESRGH